MNKEIITPIRSERLEPIVHQSTKKEKLTSSQLAEARKMGIHDLTDDNSQYDLLKRIKFQKDSARPVDKYERKLVKQHGRKKARKILGR